VLLAQKLIRLNTALSVRHGKAWASEGKKRGMLETTYGRRPGERSISRVERRLVSEGKFRREHVRPGGRLPDGTWTTKGRAIMIPIPRQQQRAAKRAARKLADRTPAPPPRPSPRRQRPNAPSSPRPPMRPEDRPADPAEVERMLRAVGLWTPRGPPRR
jgi:hypothetical protein